MLHVMEWSNDEVILLIEAYRDRPVLWDPTSTCFKVASKKNEAWNEIGVLFKVDAATVKSKMLSLLSSFRRERHKERVLSKTGAFTEEQRKPRWFAFTSMLFLMEKFQHKKKDCGVNDDVGHNSASPYDNHDLENEESIPAATMALRPKPKTFLFSNKRRVLAKRKKPTEDPRMAEAIHLLNTTVDKKTHRDENEVFGELVAHKLRGYNVDTRNIVQHLVNNILFEADMGKYDRKSVSQSPSSHSHPWGHMSASPVAPSSPQSTHEDTKCTVQYLAIDNNIIPSAGSGNNTFCFNEQGNNFTD